MVSKPTGQPVGRPTKYRPEFCEQIVEIMAQGISQSAAASQLGDGVSAGLITQWSQQYPDFLKALKRGAAKSLYALERGTMSGEIPASPGIFLMKGRARRVAEMEGDAPVEHAPDVQKVEHGTSPDMAAFLAATLASPKIGGGGGE